MSVQGVVSELVTSIQFTLSALKGCDVRTLLKNRRLQFQFQCLDVTLTYPGTLFENELFTKPKRLRDYSIALHAIHPSLLKEDSRVLFGILKEEDPSMYMVAWEIPLSKLLFGPSELVFPCSGTTESHAQYFLRFKNTSMLVTDYSLVLHSIRLSSVPDGPYSY